MNLRQQFFWKLLLGLSAIALLFSDKAPDSMSLGVAKKLLLYRSKCKIKGINWIPERAWYYFKIWNEKPYVINNESYEVKENLNNQINNKNIWIKVFNASDDFIKGLQKEPIKTIKGLPWPRFRKVVVNILRRI